MLSCTFNGDNDIKSQDDVSRYGELSPSTFPGKLIGGLCALCGIFILTLPIPIVVNSFASYYKNRLWRNEVLELLNLFRSTLKFGTMY